MTGIGGAALTNINDVKKFALAGKAIFTLRSKVSGERLTFRLAKPKDKRDDPAAPIFVGVMQGTDNETSYAYLGTIFQNQNLAYVHGRKSKIPAGSVPEKAIGFLVDQLNKNTLSNQVEVWHEGRCGCCGKTLTVPESITSGFGPVCLKRHK